MMVGAIDARHTFARYWHARYWQRLAERPAAQRAKEIDDALMPAKGWSGQPGHARQGWRIKRQPGSPQGAA